MALLAVALFLAPGAAGAYGSSWANETTTISSVRFADVSCTDSLGTTTCVAVGFGAQGAVYRGTSTGTGPASISWTAGTLPPTRVNDGLTDVDCVDANICTAVGWGGSIVRTTDGGVTWIDQKMNQIVQYTEDLEGVSCLSAQVCVATGSGGIVRTVDGGTTWLPTMVLVGGVRRIDCVVGTATCLTGAGAGSGFRTDDSGATWVPVVSLDGAPHVDVNCLTGNNCFGLGYGVIFHYSAGMWTKVTTPADPNNRTLVSISCSGSSCFAVGYNGLAMTSSDGGATWVVQTTPAPEPDLRGVSCTLTRCRAVGYDAAGDKGVIQRI